MSSTLEGLADHCVLRSPVFGRLSNGTFRRAESDGTAVMVVALGDNVAALPLRSLQREFGIEDGSDDGRMLGLIAESLDFVSSLNFGDPLPSEVLNGRASWRPAARHQQIAAARLRLQVLDLVDPAAAAKEAGQPPSVERMENEPALRAAVQRAFEQAARELQVAGSGAVMELLAEVADELSYIEALRETFLRRVQSMVEKLDALSNGVVNVDRQTALSRIRRLAHIALDQIRARFAQADEQTGGVLNTLRHVERHRSFIRKHRDWLYRSSRGWETLLIEWDSAMPGVDDASWARLHRTYQFLAPRFMPVQEWFSSAAQTAARRTKKPQNVMVW